MKTATIEVSGGVATVTRQSPGTRVVIIDHDNDEENNGQPTRDVQEKPERDLCAAALLVHAYARSNTDASSIDWDDLNAAHDQARKELGAARVREIEGVYS